MIQRTIFSSPGRAWTAVALYTIFLYASLTLAYDIYVRFFDRLGKPFMSSLMIWIYLPVGLALLAFVIFSLPRRPTAYLSFLLICLALVACLNFLTVPAKRFHFLQYGPLTLLVFDALRFRFTGRPLYLWTFVAVTIIGVGDEALQGILPQRHFGLLDIVVNSTAGSLTLAFIGWVIGEEYYPRGSRVLSQDT